MGKLEKLIAETQGEVGSIVQKPKMTEKLLSRPPFRFLHDTVMAMDKKTGFVESLFDAAEKDHRNITDKAGKTAFLSKLIDFAGICNGAALDVRENKIVAGSEAEKTNSLLIVLARAAKDSSIDYEAAATMAINGDAPGRIPRRGESSSSSSSSSSAVSASESKKEECELRKDKPVSEEKSAFDLSEVDGEIETTMKLCEGLFEKPKLNEKLLSRPPFRFLHDVVTGIASSSELLDGLFIGDESESKPCAASKALKMSYLEKLLKFTASCSGRPVEAKSSRIVAGHEPNKTNKVLQTLALIARNKGMGAISSQEAVRHVLGDKSREPEETKALEHRDVHEEEKPKSEKEEKTKEEKEETERAKNPRKSAIRPQTARKRPPKIHDKARQLAAEERPQSRGALAAQPVGVLKEGDDDVDSDESDGEERPERGPDNFNPALDEQELKSKLVRDILEDEEKEREKETKEQSGRAKRGGGINLGKVGSSFRKGNAKAPTTMGVVEVDKIRSAIQLLCQSTNPLGKCMDYVREDLNAMAKELEKWRAEYTKSCDDLEDEQRITSETLLPLQGKLNEIDEEILDRQALISTLKASIAKNDTRINELLQDMVLNR